MLMNPCGRERNVGDPARGGREGPAEMWLGAGDTERDLVHKCETDLCHFMDSLSLEVQARPACRDSDAGAEKGDRVSSLTEYTSNGFH